MRAVAGVGAFTARRRGGVDAYLAFRARLRSTLGRLDVHLLRDFLCREGLARGDHDLVVLARQSDLELTVLMHRLVLADAALSGCHRASRAWLRQHELAVPPASRGYGRPNAGGPALARSA
jgi:hypothetical protein